MLGECKNFSACHSSVQFGEFPTPSVGVFLVFCSVFLLWFSSFLFLLFMRGFFVLFCFILEGKKPISSFFFPPPIPFTQPPLPSKCFVFGSVSCSRAVWFWFLGLSCFVVVLQTHCDLKASVPVPTTIQEGGRGPTAGMLGQKVTAWAQGHREHRQMVGGQSLGGVCRESSPICLTSLASSPLPRSGASAPPLGSHVGRGYKQAYCHPLPQHETISHPPKQPKKQAFEAQLSGQSAF